MRSKKDREIKKRAAKVLLEAERQQKEKENKPHTKQVGEVEWITRGDEAYMNVVDFATVLYALKSDLQDDLYAGKYAGDEKLRKEGAVRNFKFIIEKLETFKK